MKIENNIYEEESETRGQIQVFINARNRRGTLMHLERFTLKLDTFDKAISHGLILISGH